MSCAIAQLRNCVSSGAACKYYPTVSTCSWWKGIHLSYSSSAKGRWMSERGGQRTDCAWRRLIPLAITCDATRNGKSPNGGFCLVHQSARENLTSRLCEGKKNRRSREASELGICKMIHSQRFFNNKHPFIGVRLEKSFWIKYDFIK